MFLIGPALGGTDIVKRVAFILSKLSVLSKSSSGGTSIGVMPVARRFYLAES